jgi:hypothetical protein
MAIPLGTVFSKDPRRYQLDATIELLEAVFSDASFPRLYLENGNASQPLAEYFELLEFLTRAPQSANYTWLLKFLTP